MFGNIFLLTSVLSLIVIFFIHKYNKEEDRKLEQAKKQREVDEQLWMEDLKENHPEFYEAIKNNTKNNLH